MPAVFQFTRQVDTQEIDALGHVNNVAYVRWLQDAAVAHSTAQGWPLARYRELGFAWVVRRHTIEYLAPASVGQTIKVETWVSDMQRVTSLRKYRIVENGRLLARAETNWAFIRLSDARLSRVPDVVASAFEIVAADPPLSE